MIVEDLKHEVIAQLQSETVLEKVKINLQALEDAQYDPNSLEGRKLTTFQAIFSDDSPK